MSENLVEIILISFSVTSYLFRFIIVSSKHERHDLFKIKSILELTSMLGFMLLILMNQVFLSPAEKINYNSFNCEKDYSLKFSASVADLIFLYLNLILNIGIFKNINFEKVLIIFLSIAIGVYVFTECKELSIFKSTAVSLGILSLFAQILELKKLFLKNKDVILIVITGSVLIVLMSFMDKF